MPCLQNSEKKVFIGSADNIDNSILSTKRFTKYMPRLRIKLDESKLLALRLKGHTYEQIGRKLMASKPIVVRRMAEIERNLPRKLKYRVENPITKKHGDVIRLRLRGYTFPKIASTLNITEETVKERLRKAMPLLHEKTIAQLRLGQNLKQRSSELERLNSVQAKLRGFKIPNLEALDRNAALLALLPALEKISDKFQSTPLGRDDAKGIATLATLEQLHAGERKAGKIILDVIEKVHKESRKAYKNMPNRFSYGEKEDEIS